MFWSACVSGIFRKWFCGNFSHAKKIFFRIFFEPENFPEIFFRQQFCSGNFSCGAQSHLSGDSNNSTLSIPYCHFSETRRNAYATDPKRECTCIYSVFKPRVFPPIFVKVYVTALAHAARTFFGEHNTRYVLPIHASIIFACSKTIYHQKNVISYRRGESRDEL